MIDAVSGTLASKTPTYAVVCVGGFNLRVLISVSCFETLPAVGRDVALLTYLHVREDALQLFGFADEVERNLFERLISVSGIGPRLAVGILSGDRVRMVGGEVVTIDLGGRQVRIVPRSGHTRSDLAVVLEEPRLVWCGDLAWNGLFPNYMDATPSDLSRHVRALLEEPAVTWIPGHGSLSDRAALETYVTLLDDVEAAARRAFEAGTPAADASQDYRPPGGLGDWVLFSEDYYEVAFRAWERELKETRSS